MTGSLEDGLRADVGPLATKSLLVGLVGLLR